MGKPAAKPRQSSISFSTSLALKADTRAVIDQALEIEDEFNSLYEVGQDGVILLAPPFIPGTLVNLCTRNNILQQCVHAMEVNVDGTGHTIEPVDPLKRKPMPAPTPPEDPNGNQQAVKVAKVFPPKADPSKPGDTANPVGADPMAEHQKQMEAQNNDPEKKKAEAFFKEPFPGQSMLYIRRKLRVDLEQCGYGYLEALRNAAGELVFVRHVDAPTIRMVKLDNPVPVVKKITREGAAAEVTVLMRERRFMQIVGTKRIYFREFGASRQISKITGKWIGPKDVVAITDIGTELIHFIVDRDAKTPYGVPRWINNLPSILGSRKAEEFNLEFFDAGGIPPAIILVAGGAMSTSVKEQLLQHLSGRGRAKHRACVVEIQSASGSIEGTQPKVDVKVERFGDARQNDSMFQKYDEKCEEHVRVAFRLPPLFVGRSGDYSFATAMTSYMIAEEQVFAPERTEFDEIINSTIMKEIGVTNFKFVSKPITLKNAEVMLQGVKLVQDVIDGAERVDAINKITGNDLQFSAGAEHKTQLANQPPPFGGKGGDPAGQGGGGGSPTTGSRSLGGVPLTARLSKEGEIALTANDIVTLAHKWSVAARLEKGEMSNDERAAILDFVETLKGDARDLFNRVLAGKSFAGAGIDVGGIGELAGTCAHLTSRERVQVTAKTDGTSHELATAVRESNQRMLAIVEKMLVTERPIHLTAQLIMPERKGSKSLTFSDGRKVTLKNE